MKIFFKLVLMAIFTLSLAACDIFDSDSDLNSSDTISGTAATGAPIDGYVYVVDKNGSPSDAVATASDGSFIVEVNGMVGPFMIKVEPNNGTTLYSYAEAAGVIANITPLTNLALFTAANRKNLATIYDAWDGTGITATEIKVAKAIVNANLVSNLTVAGIDSTTYDIFATAFNADSTGIDAVLDSLNITVDFSGGTVSIANVSDQTSIAFNFAINTNNTDTSDNSTSDSDDPTVDVTIPSGNYSLTVTGSISSSLFSTTIPEVTFNDLPAPNAADVEEIANSQYTGISGTITTTSIIDTESHKQFNLKFTGTDPTVGEVIYDLTYDYVLQ
ncbi:MAG: hypothetical protein HQL46_01310 [Gammaproteobacteria bacterium]|nr:hypothetical protein [Gammaproteobacteria bacterium]